MLTTISYSIQEKLAIKLDRLSRESLKKLGQRVLSRIVTKIDQPGPGCYLALCLLTKIMPIHAGFEVEFFLLECTRGDKKDFYGYKGLGHNIRDSKLSWNVIYFQKWAKSSPWWQLKYSNFFFNSGYVYPLSNQLKLVYSLQSQTSVIMHGGELKQRCSYCFYCCIGLRNLNKNLRLGSNC